MAAMVYIACLASCHHRPWYGCEYIFIIQKELLLESFEVFVLNVKTQLMGSRFELHPFSLIYQKNHQKAFEIQLVPFLYWKYNCSCELQYNIW